MTEPVSSQLCPVPGQQAEGITWSTDLSEHQEMLLSYAGGDLAQGPKEFVGSPSGKASKDACALDGSAGGRSWSRGPNYSQPFCEPDPVKTRPKKKKKKLENLNLIALSCTAESS